MSDTPALLPPGTLANHLDVPEFLLRDLPPTQRAGSVTEALYDVVAAKAHLRRQGVIFVDGRPVLIR